MNQSYHDGFMTKCAQSNLSYETAMELWDLNSMMKSAQAQQVRKGNGSWMTGINNVANNAEDLWNGVSNGVANGVRSVGNAAGKAWNAVGNAADKATTGQYNTQDGNWFENGVNRAQNAYENATNYLGDAAEGAGMMASDAVTAGKNYLTDLGNRVVDNVQRTGKRIQGMRDDFYKRQRERNRRAIQMGKDMASSAVNAGKSLWNRFTGWGKEKYNQVKNTVRQGVQAGQNAYDKYVTQPLENMGAEIGGGIEQRRQDRWNNDVNAYKSPVQNTMNRYGATMSEAGRRTLNGDAERYAGRPRPVFQW